MLNILWPSFLIISIIYAILSGNLKNINNSIFESANSAVNLCITLLGTMCLWNGIMQIASKTTAMKKITRFLKPIIKILFPKIEKNTDTYEKISMNMVANILGLGNAATPLGLQAMEEMQKENLNKEYLSDNMMILIVLNTSSLQIIPTTIIAIRTSLGSNNPTRIIFPVWFSTICAGIVGIIVTKLIIFLTKKGCE